MMEPTDHTTCKATMDNFYGIVINNVIEQSREAFYEEDPIEMNVLLELKELWWMKVQAILNTRSAVALSKHHSSSMQVPSPPDVKEEAIGTGADSDRNVSVVKPTIIVPILIRILATPPFEIRVNVTQEQLDNDRISKLLTNDLLTKLVTMAPEHATVALQSIIHNEDKPIWQVDGSGGSSDESEDGDDVKKESEYDRSDENNDADMNQIVEGEVDREPEPDSGDDITDDEVGDTENMIVCQYTNVKRNKNHWKFQFQNGILAVDGVEYVFQRASGDGIW